MPASDFRFFVIKKHEQCISNGVNKKEQSHDYSFRLNLYLNLIL